MTHNNPRRGLETLISSVVLAAMLFSRSPLSGQDATITQPPRGLSRAEIAKRHSTLYKGYQTGKNLKQLAASGSGEIEVSATVFPGIMGGQDEDPRHLYPHWYLRLLGSEADAVVVGTRKHSSSSLTEGEDFIFSDFEMLVEEVIKNNPAAPIPLGSTIIVTRPGGAMRISGRVVRAVDGRFEPFKLRHRYVLFVKFVPQTGAYRAFADWSFELRDSGPLRGARVLAPQPPWGHLESAKDPEAFLTEVRFAVADSRR
ncbi:MAG TPA: hypothetical protein VNN18_09835 [Candidatus Xenobia bacterium]|nr:hypothetical protein [Candidatus Xenobia bacterium]